MKYILIFSLLFLGCQGPQGDIGPRGVSGDRGETGSNGYSSLISTMRADIDSELCASEIGLIVNSGLDLNRDGILNVSESTSSAIVCDGIAGNDGQDAEVPQYAVKELINPCGASIGFDEVLLRLYNGEILCSFSDNAAGLNTRFSLLKAGHYATTDGTNCTFSVDEDFTVVDQHGNVWIK